MARKREKLTKTYEKYIFIELIVFLCSKDRYNLEKDWRDRFDQGGSFLKIKKIESSKIKRSDPQPWENGPLFTTLTISGNILQIFQVPKKTAPE